jgi:hypothetical protein
MLFGVVTAVLSGVVNAIGYTIQKSARQSRDRVPVHSRRLTVWSVCKLFFRVEQSSECFDHSSYSFVSQLLSLYRPPSSLTVSTQSRPPNHDPIKTNDQRLCWFSRCVRWAHPHLISWRWGLPDPKYQTLPRSKYHDGKDDCSTRSSNE